MKDQVVCRLLSCALFDYKELPETDDWQSVYNELNYHEVVAITAKLFGRLNLPEDIKAIWKKRILQQLTFNIKNKYIQDTLPISVPYIILKGSSASQYYPYPEFRTMGDIDIMTTREDFDAAFQQLADSGYLIEKELDREICFIKNGIVIELHRYFASLNDLTQAKYLDDLIISNIKAPHILPDLVNGLVLLEHISQHMENGLGLRQIIDWMMFVHKCLADEKWPEFRDMAQGIGLEKLAIATTHMCEIYLGLPERGWCAGADEKLCEQFMNYTLACGNFGNKWIDEDRIVENALTRARNPKAAFRLLQERGLINWHAARKHRILKPFAWIYQLGRYISRGVHREEATGKLMAEYKAAKQRNTMFDKLGVKQTSKGLVTYKDGQYMKD